MPLLKNTPSDLTSLIELIDIAIEGQEALPKSELNSLVEFHIGRSEMLHASDEGRALECVWFPKGAHYRVFSVTADSFAWEYFIRIKPGGGILKTLKRVDQAACSQAAA